MTDSTVTTERRKEERKRPLGLIYVELSSANGGMLRDLSESGFAMRAMMPLRPGDSTSFSFSLDPETRLAGECKVSWVEEDGRVAGLEFTSIPKQLPGTVREWLRENSFAVPPSAIPAKQSAKEASTLQELRDELRSINSNARTAERDEKKVNVSPPKKETKVEASPVQKQKADVAPLTKLVSNSEQRNESLERIKDLPSFPELQPLPTFPDVEVLSDPVHVKRGYPRSGISMAIRMMIVLALVACAVAYHRPLGNAIIWLGQRIVGSNVPEISYTPNTEESQPGPASVPAPGQPSPNPPQTAPDKDTSTTAGDGTVDTPTPSTPGKNSIEVPPVVENTPPQSAKKSQTSTTAAASAPLPATNRTTTYSAPPIPASDLAGQQEYLSAQEILKNNNTVTNLPEAVRLLWVAVEKGNSNAEVLLAELYRTGQGVTKSCDQTKILLTAAAKKGNSEAQRHLGQFVKEGCE